ncbi:phosphoenolpyruvate carboxykinase (ATP) [Hanamia caeni]|nr:phosphoenolpyruvate carboxykinase (ATP) [Hanamia caeni]
MNLLFSTGLPAAENIIYQASHENLIKDCLRKNEGALNEEGIFVTKAGNVNDATSMTVYVVKNAFTGNTIECNGSSKPIDATIFLQLYQKTIDHFGKKQIWIRDAFVLNDSGQKVNIRSINEEPAGNLVVLDMFSEPSKNELENFNPDWYLVHAPEFFADSAIDGIDEKDFFMVNYETKTMLIGGAIFTTNIKHRILSILMEHSL